MATILVTGAAGFIGSHTVDQLLRAGHTVTGIDNFRTGRRENLAAAGRDARFSLVEADVAEPDTLDRLAAQHHPQAIIHLAALVSVPESIADPALNQRLNFDATRLVAEAARRHAVGRIVFASSAAVYGDTREIPTPETADKRPLSPYGAAKLASEALLLDGVARAGVTVRCLRYFNVYGPRQDPRSPYSGVLSIFRARLRAGEAPVIFGDGGQTRDFISVHDVARANVLAATAPGISSGVVNICTGRAASLNRVLALMQRGGPHARPPVFAPPREGDIRDSCGSAEKARDELGFTAGVSLEAGLAELVRAG